MVIGAVAGTLTCLWRFSKLIAMLGNKPTGTQKDSHAYRAKLLSEALAAETDIRYPALAIEALGLPAYQKLMDRGQRMLLKRLDTV